MNRVAAGLLVISAVVSHGMCPISARADGRRTARAAAGQEGQAPRTLTIAVRYETVALPSKATVAQGG